MLDKMELAAPAYVEAADRCPDVKGRRLIRWGGLAACLGMTVAAFVLLHPDIEENPLTTEDIQDISVLSSVYGDTLLAENLDFSDAENTTIQLSRSEDGDISDTSSWDTLSVTAEYVDCNVMLNCSFHASEETGTIDPPSEILSYGDIRVFLYRKEPTEFFEYIYHARFACEGIVYDLSTQSNDSQGIYDLLDVVIGVSPHPDAEEDEDPPPHPFADILGYENYRIHVEESQPNFYIWRYYTEIDGESQCIADTFGWYDHPGAYSVDLDGDGISEFITNCVYGDGAERVHINRICDGVIEQGYLDQRYLEEKYYLSLSGPAGAIAGRYDPRENVFVVTGPSRYGGTLTITISYEEQEAFKFLPYDPIPMD